MNQLPFNIRGGRVIGRDHLRSGKNCQDGYALRRLSISGREYLLGVVSDGCSGGAYSEVAGELLPVYVAAQISNLLHFEIPIQQIPAALYPHVIGFLEGLRKLIPFVDFPEIVAFVQNYLLSTLVGFVLDEEEGVIFYAGDGLVQINKEIIRPDYENRSPYVGYHLVPRSVLVDQEINLPRTFVVSAFETQEVERLVVATDGFTRPLLSRLWEEAFASPLGIQLWLNFINGPRNPKPHEGLFYDDAAVVVLEREEGGRGDEGDDRPSGKGS